MGHFIMAMLLPLLLQLSGTNAAPPSQPEIAVAAQVEPQSGRGAAPATPATPTPPTPPQPASQEALDKFIEQRIEEALRGLPSDGNREMSPETERAIANAVEKFLGDPSIKSAIAQKIQQVTPPGHPEMLVALLVPISFFATMALVAWLLYRRSQARMRTRMEFHQQVLAKFTTGEQFANFLNTKGSQQLLEGMWGGQVNFKERLLKHVRLGAIFGVLGLGLLALAIFTSDDGYGFLAVLCLGLGIGFLVSARVSYRLSEKMGLLRENGSGGVSASGSQP